MPRRRAIERVVGKYDLSDENDEGDTLVQFCLKDYVIKNIYYNLPPLYTWKSSSAQPTCSP